MKGTKTKTTTKATTEIMLAVAGWQTAEQECDRIASSALWRLVFVVRAANDSRAFADATVVRETLLAAIEKVFGEGESRKRAARISQIMKIGLNAKQEDYDRWAKEGTGFVRAYEEFAHPQKNPAKTPEGWTKPGMGTEEDIAAQ